MKIVTVIGARPQFIKAAMFSKEFRKNNEEVIIHTGQHYDINMSDIFFEELNIPRPEYNLNIGSGMHGYQTAKMLEYIEPILIEEKPDAVLVYGDTNSTLAGSLAASKLHIPIIHVEAGLRSYNKLMPEEQNRILTDHISTFLFCPSTTSIDNLTKENITENVFLVGDIMKDSVLHYSAIAKNTYSLENWIYNNLNFHSNMEILKKGFFLATIHRAENTDDLDKLKTIFEAFSKLDFPVLIPLHPRTRKVIQSNFVPAENIIIINPVGYVEMLFLQMSCKGVITDSGGIQKEAYILKKPCVTLRDQTEWIETLNNGWNRLSKIQSSEIIDKINSMRTVSISNYLELYGLGNTSKLIVEILEKEIKK